MSPRCKANFCIIYQIKTKNETAIQHITAIIFNSGLFSI